MHFARGGQLGGDLEAGVPAADDERDAFRQGVRRAVAAAVQLHDLVAEIGGHRRRERHLERPRGDDDLIGFVGAIGQFDEEAFTVAAADRSDAAVVLDRQLEAPCVLGEVVDDVIPARVAGRVSREREPGQAVVADRREERERVPPAAPGGGRLVGGLEDA